MAEQIKINIVGGAKKKGKSIWANWIMKNNYTKVITALLIIIIILVVLQLFNKPIMMEPIAAISGYNKTLYKDGDGSEENSNWNLVVIPQMALYCQKDNTVETIFQSIYNDAGEFWIFYESATEGWISYCSTRPTNELQHIYGWQVYWVTVENNCELSIKCPD